MELNKLDIFIEIAKQKPKKRVAVAAAEDINVLEAIYAAKANGICDPLLVGDSKKIRENAEKFNIDLTGTEIIEEKNPANASRICVKLIREEKAHIMMKGLVSTAEFLRAILDKENGLRCGNLLSHIGFFDPKRYHKLIAVTDAAQNVAPSLEDKISIINNAVNMFNNLGINRPKIAVLAAVEAVNYKMPACVDAALITMMNKRGQFKNAIIDGPLAFDVAISKEAAKHKD
jgi:phosphate butyryltransferase